MTFREARLVTTYWQESPPEHELMARFAAAYIGWRPASETTEEAIIAEHRRSLELRWKAGAMNPKQLFEAMGGRLGVGGSSLPPQPGLQMTGIGDWPPKF